MDTVEQDSLITNMENDALARKGPAKQLSLTESSRLSMIRLSKSSKLFTFKGKVKMVRECARVCGV